ncbi:MAG: hypothetical protein M3N41_07935 [Acidobacteriota bacterium]|nr:hypothetical protein [Acidobacteriota bacterium]
MRSQSRQWIAGIGILTAIPFTFAVAAAQPPTTAPPGGQSPAAPSGFSQIQNAGELCRNVEVRRPKQHLHALPANVIDPPRTDSGWPDFQGTWSAAAYVLNGLHSIEIGNDPAGNAILCEDNSNIGSLLIDSPTGMIPYNPEAQKKKMEYLAGIYAPMKRMDIDTDVRCFFRGVPHDMTAGIFRIGYVPGFVVMTTQGVTSPTRIIPMDGRRHLGDGVKLMMGDSVGHWQGHTLIVETTNNSGNTWFDKHGTWHSEEMRVTEQWTMVDQNTMYYQATIDDPTVFTRPWSLAMTFNKMPENNAFVTREETCHEGERSVDRSVRAGQRARAAGIKGYHIHVDLETGKAINAEEQKYLDESGQPHGLSYAPTIK